MSKIKSISERVSYKDNPGGTTIVISPKIDRWKESIMLAWIIAWTFCGTYFIYELAFNSYDRNTTLALVIMLSFWLYFEYKIGKAVLWRKHGVEFIKIEDNKLFYKRSIYNYGKAKMFFCDNVKNLSVIQRNKLSPFAFLENSAWFIGGEVLQFEHKGKIIRFAMQLNEKEIGKLVDVLKRKIKKHS